MSTSSLAVVTASVVGVVIGQLTAGVPLAQALRRRERERNKPKPKLPADTLTLEDLGHMRRRLWDSRTPLAQFAHEASEPWPEDRARYLLDIWDAPDVAWPTEAAP